jgi:hypothetical protein
MPYSERYVAFLDILGFGDIVRATERDATAVRYNELVSLLTEIGSRERTDQAIGDDFKFQSFSDSIVLSCDTTPGGLVHLLERLAQPVRRPDPPVLRNETELHIDSFAK